jgi:antibiotic biosynthesis monooxygenase (ABM) superfamily enzyme
MQVTALVRITPAGSASFGALRAFVKASRRLRCFPGFRRWQTFRSLGADNTLVVALDWDSAEGARAALAHPDIRSCLTLAEEWGFRIEPAVVLHASFERQLTRHASVITLLRLSHTESPRRGSAARDNDFALQAMAAPGSTRLYGAREPRGGTAICRIDFDTDDGVWHFLDSPQRQAWSSWARDGFEEETWALNLPRFEHDRVPTELPDHTRPAKPEGSLAVQFSVSEDRTEAHIWLQGRMDARGSGWCDRLCEILLSDGCLRLEVDVSGLTAMSPELVTMLTRTARSLKEGGGQFILIDNEARVNRVTRSKHLATSMR